MRDRALATMALAAVAAGGLWVFIAIADAVGEHDTRTIDERVLLAMRNPADLAHPIGPRWLQEMGRDVTALGGLAVLTLVTLAVAGYLWLARRPRALALLLSSVVGGWVLSFALKRAFHRPRPDLVPHGSFVYSSSFPSSHSMMSAITYLTLGALLAHTLSRRSEKAFVLGWALALTTFVGVSRVYLGVHWPTDVVAGWAIGAAWAVGCGLVAQRIVRERAPRT